MNVHVPLQPALRASDSADLADASVNLESRKEPHPDEIFFKPDGYRAVASMIQNECPRVAGALRNMATAMERLVIPRLSFSFGGGRGFWLPIGWRRSCHSVSEDDDLKSIRSGSLIEIEQTWGAIQRRTRIPAYQIFLNIIGILRLLDALKVVGSPDGLVPILDELDPYDPTDALARRQVAMFGARMNEYLHALGLMDKIITDPGGKPTGKMPKSAVRMTERFSTEWLERPVLEKLMADRKNLVGEIGTVLNRRLSSWLGTDNMIAAPGDYQYSRVFLDDRIDPRFIDDEFTPAPVRRHRIIRALKDHLPGIVYDSPRGALHVVAVNITKSEYEAIFTTEQSARAVGGVNQDKIYRMTAIRENDNQVIRFCKAFLNSFIVEGQPPAIQFGEAERIYEAILSETGRDKKSLTESLIPHIKAINTSGTHVHTMPMYAILEDMMNAVWLFPDAVLPGKVRHFRESLSIIAQRRKAKDIELMMIERIKATPALVTT